MDDDLTRALGDLAGTMTDDPARLLGVHRRARSLRARRTARRGAVATGALGVAAATGVLLRPSGSSPDTQVTATQPSPPPTTTPPPATTCPPRTETPPTTWPTDADYILTAFATARVLAVTDDSVTVEVLSNPDLPPTITLSFGPEVTYSDGDVPIGPADLSVDQIVDLYLAQPEGETVWTLAHVVINPQEATDGLPDGAVVDGNSVTLPC